MKPAQTNDPGQPVVVCHLPPSCTEAFPAAADRDSSLPHAGKAGCRRLYQHNRQRLQQRMWHNVRKTCNMQQENIETNSLQLLHCWMIFIRTIKTWTGSPILKCLASSYVSHSYVSSLMHRTSCLVHRSAIIWSSSIL